MIVDTLIFIDLLMSEHGKALLIFIFMFFLVLANKALKLLQMNGGYNIETKEVVTKTRKKTI